MIDGEMTRKGSETQSLPVRLSDHEMKERAEHLAWLLQRKEEQEAEHVALKERMKAEKGNLDGEMAHTAKALRDRAEERT